jgi:uncharacterized protein (DUF362 family)
MATTPCGGRRITRRGFLLGAAVGLCTGAAAAWLGQRAHRAFTGRTVEVPRPEYGMPGRYPGRVVEVHHPAAVGDDHRIDPPTVRQMMHQGMCELTGAGHPREAWRRFFEVDDVVGIKVNPVGFSRRRGTVSSISSPEVLLEVVEGLKSAGVRPRNIIVFERYASEFRQAGYETVLRERSMDGVRWYAAGAGYDPGQLNIDGYDERSRPDRDPHVVGYDPDVCVSMGFCDPQHSPRDDRRFRSHLSMIVARMVNKFVTIPCLKDHRSAGVTLALKNLSHGLNNNVARSHLAGIYRLGGSMSGPNQCNTFIPTAAGQDLIRRKATLHILDGLIGVYEGGPGSWNRTWATWPHRSLFFATDPVALDHVGWDIIDIQRARQGWRPVAQMGLLDNTRAERVTTGLATLSAGTAPGAAVLYASAENLFGGWGSESFDRRQPEHVILAGTHGLGVFDANGIEHRRLVWDAKRQTWVTHHGAGNA